MSEEITSVAEVGGSTPLDAILGRGSAGLLTENPSQESVSDQPQAEPVYDADDDGPQVSRLALHRERERRQKMDQRVRELEEEIQRFHEAKWGTEEQQPQAEASQVATHDQDNERRAFEYNQSYANFLAKHGKAKVEAIDAAVNSLPAPQKAHVLALATQGNGDPVERVFQYVQQLGVLDEGFKPTTLQDALAGKKQEPTGNDRNDDVMARIDQREQHIMAVHRATTFNASRAEFVSEFGKSNFEKLDTATQSLLSSGNPAAAEFAAIVTQSENPVATAAELLGKLGLWSPEEPQRVQSVMPSSFASVRSVAGRRGPAFAGPTPLSDIFKR
jgi:hypothetical protein